MTEQDASRQQTSENLPAESEVLRNLSGNSDAPDGLEALRDLSPGSRITVTRKSPTYADGFLGHITIPTAGQIDLASEIRSNWGGGMFQLQPKRMAANGKMEFGKGCVFVKIAGEPTFEGRRYKNGVLEPVSDAQPVAPVVFQPPQSGGSDLATQLLGLVQTQLTTATGRKGEAVDFSGLGQLVGALGGILGNRPESKSPVGELAEAFGLFQKMQNAAPKAPEPAESSGADDLLGVPGLAGILMSKFLGGNDKPAPPPTPYWAQAPQYGAPQAYSGPQAGYPGYHHNPQPYPPQSATPPGSNWPQQTNGVPYGTAPHAASPTQPNPAPTGSMEPGGGIPPQEAAQPPVGNAEGEYEGSEEEPFTVDHLEAELQHMGPEQRNQFLAEVMTRMGVDKMFGDQITEKMGQAAGGSSQSPDAPPGDAIQFPAGFALTGEAFSK